MTPHELERLLEAVRARSTGISSTLHGDHHSQCVAHVGAELARDTPGCDALVVFLFGLLHDAMRENDGHDPNHGPRAARLARELYEGDLLPLDGARLDTLAAACERHADGETSTDETIGVCWDADRLHLWRVGIEPDPELLSTVAARRPAWIVGAPALARTGYDWAALLAAHDGAPTTESFWIEAGRLLAGKYAGSFAPDEARAKVARLEAAGVTAFVDLTEEAELEPYGHLLDGAARHRRFPIRDLSHPTAAEMERIVQAIDDELDAGGTVYAHCWGGCGRTGTVVCCWLVRHGVAAEVALARFAAASFGVCGRPCPETEAQRALVLGWPQRVHPL